MKTSTLIMVSMIAGVSALALPPTTVDNSTITNVNTDGKNDAQQGSTINSGVRARGATIRNSTITNENRNVINQAINNSKINSGIQADGATIKDSTLRNTNVEDRKSVV